MSNQVTIKMTVKGVPMELTGTMDEVMAMSQKMSQENAQWEEEQKKKAEKKDKEFNIEAAANDLFTKLTANANEAVTKMTGLKSKEIEVISSRLVSAATKKALEKANEWMKKAQAAAEEPKAEKTQEPEKKTETTSSDSVNPS